MTGGQWWALYGFTVLSAFISAFYSVKAWRETRGPGAVFTQYTLVRSLVIFGFALFSPYGGHPVVLAAGLSLLFLQAGDTLIGFAKKDPAETYGPMVFAIISTILAAWCIWSVVGRPAA